MCSCYIMDNLAKVYIRSSQKHVIYGKQKHLGMQKVAWPRKTAATKRTDIGVWPRLMQYQYILIGLISSI